MKKKFLNFVFAFAIIFVSSICFTACGEDEVKEKILNIQASYKDNTYDFSNVVEFTYDENMAFSANDFIITLNYDNNSSKSITSGFTLKTFKIDGENDLEVSSFLPGNYKLKFSYETFSCELYFTVNPISLNQDNLTSDIESSYYYSSEGVKPSLTFSYNDKVLVLDTDYTLEYGTNDQIGMKTGSVLFKGLGIYSGEIEYKFDIAGKLIDEPNFEKSYTFSYNGDDYVKNIETIVNYSSLNGVDSISYSYSKNDEQVFEVKDAGEYSVTATINVEYGFASVPDKTFIVKINPLDISNAQENISINSDDSSDYIYNGENQYLRSVSCKINDSWIDITEGTDYTIMYSNNTNAGNASYTITGNGNYTGTYNGTFKINSLDISNAQENISVNRVDNSDYIYNGESQYLRSVSCKINDSWTDMAKDADYTIIYSNNTNAGNASYTITGNGNYTGTYEGTFVIKKQIININDLNWNILITEELTYNGKEQSYNKLNIPEDLISVVSAEYKSYTDMFYKTEQSLINAGVYYYRAELSIANNNYAFNNNEASAIVSYGDSIIINPVKASVKYSGSYSFVYTGELIKLDANDISVVATVDGQEKTLNDTEYTLSFSDNAINVGGYTTTIKLNSSNYYFDTGSQNHSDEDSLYYSITTKELEESNLTITLPNVTQVVWGSYELAENNGGSIKYGDVDLLAEFSVLFDGSSGLWKLSCKIKNSNYSCAIKDKDITGTNADTSIIIVLENRYFSSFKLNGTSLTANEIQNLITNGFNMGDVVYIECNDGYTFDYLVMASGSETIVSQQSSYTFVVGVERVNDLFETKDIIEIYHDYGVEGNYSSISTGEIEISKNVFDTFMIGSTDMISDYDWYNIRYISTIFNTDEISLICQDGYTVRVEAVINGENTAVCENEQSVDLTLDDTYESVSIKVYRGSNSLSFLTLDYTVKAKS